MKLQEIVDSLIEISCQEMPEEARKSLDDSIDHIVSNMTEKELSSIVEDSFRGHFDHLFFGDGDDEEVQAIRSMMEGNIAIA